MAASDSFRLAPCFVPGHYDVICGRGKSCYGHTGNLNLRSMVRLYTKDYSLAKSKDEKSTIVTSIVAEVRRRSPLGGFVKKDSRGWYEVGEFLAREKVSQCFRDLLESHYKSSTRMRRQTRQERRKGSMEPIGSASSPAATPRGPRGTSPTPRPMDVTTEIDRLAAFASTNWWQAVARNCTALESQHTATAIDAANSAPDSQTNDIAVDAAKIVPFGHASNVVLGDQQSSLVVPSEPRANGHSFNPHPSEISFFPIALCSSIDMSEEISWPEVPGGPENELPDNSFQPLGHSSREYHSLPDDFQNHDAELLFPTTHSTTMGNNNNSNDHRPASPPASDNHPSDCSSLPDLYLRRDSGLSVSREVAQELQAMEHDDVIDVPQQQQQQQPNP